VKLLTRCLFILFLIAVTICQTLAFQNPNQASEQEQTLKLKAELVEIRAVVTDKSGKIIDNLSKDDFELFENNSPQQIIFFSRERIGEKVAAANTDKSANPIAALSQPPPKPTRTIVFFIDTLHLSLSSVQLVKQALKRFINQQMTNDDLVCLVTSNGSLGLAEQFTQNRQLLRYGIERIRPQGNLQRSNFTPYIASMALRGDPISWNVAGQIMRAEGLTSPASNCGRPTDLDECNIRLQASFVLNEAIVKRKNALTTLKYVTDRLAKLPGQRIINLFSDGFSLMQEGGSMDTGDIQAVTSHATRAGVVIYSMDAKGLDASAIMGDASMGSTPLGADFSSAMSMSRSDMQNGLNALAYDTGGKYLLNTNDLGNSVAKVLEENRTYYSLAYYPNTEKELNKFRRLSARVKGHPEYTVRTQKGYLPAELFTPEKEEIAKTPQQQLLKAIVAPLPTTNLGVSVTADYLENDTDNSQVWAQIYVDGKDLEYKQENGRFILNVEVVTQVFNNLGKMVSSTIDTIQGNLQSQRLALAKQNGFRQMKRLTLKPGAYQVRIGVREPSSEKIGTATAWVEVPDLKKNKLAMSGVFLSESASSREQISKAAEQVSSTTKTSQSKEKEFFLSKVTQGIPVYKSGNLLAYYFVIYNQSSKSSAPTDLVMQSEILQDENIVFKSDWQPISERMLKQGKKGLELGGMLELNLKPGIYEMRISVKDAKAKKTVQQSSIIGVEP
jgi:VWFA-related protein